MISTKKRLQNDILIGERLQKARKSAGMTQDELAIAVNLSQDQISRYELGKIKPSGPLIRQLSTVLQVPVEYLIGDEDHKNGPELLLVKDETLRSELDRLINMRLTIEEKLIIYRLFELFRLKKQVRDLHGKDE